jgi:hypothetical protein
MSCHVPFMQSFHLRADSQLAVMQELVKHSPGPALLLRTSFRVDGGRRHQSLTTVEATWTCI